MPGRGPARDVPQLMREVSTPVGPARVHPGPPVDAVRAMLLLGHSAGGGVDDPALLAAVRGAAKAGVASLLVELPYRVAGRRPAGPADADQAWLAIAEAVRDPAQPLVCGGRSYGGRAACRTAAQTGSSGVLCLAFPLLPPYGSSSVSRLPELDGVEVPVLVIQGDSDPYGMPPPGPHREVLAVRGDHSLRTALPGVAAAAAGWLDALLTD